MANRTLSPGWKATFTTMYLLVVLYMLVILGQAIVGLVVPLLLFIPSYFIWWRVDTYRAKRQQPSQEDNETGQTDTPLEILKRRYAEGELSDAEFERKCEQLVDEPRQTDSASELDTSGETALKE